MRASRQRNTKYRKKRRRTKDGMAGRMRIMSREEESEEEEESEVDTG